MNRLLVKIPFWYVFFIRFMPNFYRDVPVFDATCTYTTRVDEITSSFIYPIKYGREKGNYPNNHIAYLKVRWRAMWKDFWTYGSGTGIEWNIYKKNIW